MCHFEADEPWNENQEQDCLHCLTTQRQEEEQRKFNYLEQERRREAELKETDQRGRQQKKERPKEERRSRSNRQRRTKEKEKIKEEEEEEEEKKRGREAKQERLVEDKQISKHNDQDCRANPQRNQKRNARHRRDEASMEKEPRSSSEERSWARLAPGSPKEGSDSRMRYRKGPAPEEDRKGRDTGRTKVERYLYENRMIEESEEEEDSRARSPSGRPRSRATPERSPVFERGKGAQLSPRRGKGRTKERCGEEKSPEREAKERTYYDRSGEQEVRRDLDLKMQKSMRPDKDKDVKEQEQTTTSEVRKMPRTSSKYGGSTSWEKQEVPWKREVDEKTGRTDQDTGVGNSPTPPIQKGRETERSTGRGKIIQDWGRRGKWEEEEPTRTEWGEKEEVWTALNKMFYYFPCRGECEEYVKGLEEDMIYRITEDFNPLWSKEDYKKQLYTFVQDMIHARLMTEESLKKKVENFLEVWRCNETCRQEVELLTPEQKQRLMDEFDPREEKRDYSRQMITFMRTRYALPYPKEQEARRATHEEYLRRFYEKYPCDEWAKEYVGELHPEYQKDLIMKFAPTSEAEDYSRQITAFVGMRRKAAEAGGKGKGESRPAASSAPPRKKGKWKNKKKKKKIKKRQTKKKNKKKQRQRVGMQYPLRIRGEES
jgi:hypothetical protein